jgi:hypothetical protein
MKRGSAVSKISIIQSIETRIDKLQYKNSMIVKDILNLRRQFEESNIESKKLSISYAIDSLTRDYENIEKEISNLGSECSKHKINEKNVIEANQQIFNPFNFSELLNQPPKNWFVENVLGRGDLGLIYGSPGCGKTFVVIDLIFALSQPGRWAGRFDIKTPLSIAYCAGEGFSGLPARFSAAAANRNIENIPSFTFFKQIPQLYDSSIIPETIDQFIEDWQYRQHKKECENLDVLIIDTFHSAILGADENSSCDMGVIIQSCRKAIEKLNCSVIMVHHTTKDGANERGSGAIRGAMDFMIKVEKIGREDSNQGRIHCSKIKDGQPWNAQNFELIRPDNHESCFVRWESPLPSDIIDQPRINQDKFRIMQILSQNPTVGFTIKSLYEALDIHKEKIRRPLAEMLDMGVIERKLQYPEHNSSNRNPWLFYFPKP